MRYPADSRQNCTTIESSLEECTFSLPHVPLGKKCTLCVACSTCFTEDCTLNALKLCFDQYNSVCLSKFVSGARIIFTACAPSRKHTLHDVCATYATEECAVYALSQYIGVTEYVPYMPQVFHKIMYTNYLGIEDATLCLLQGAS